jgi:HEAT repeat protein
MNPAHSHYSFILFLAFATTSMAFDGANWIWAPSQGHPPAEAVCFRSELTLPEHPALESAELLATCDNMFVAYLNGQPVGESATDNSAWSSPQRWDVSRLLLPGPVVLAVQGVNSLPGPAGLIVSLRMRFADGSTVVHNSDASWRCSRPEPKNWMQTDFDDGKWERVQLHGAHGVAPWGQLRVSAKSVATAQRVGTVRARAKKLLSESSAAGQAPREQAPGEDFAWPESIIYLGADRSLYRPAKKSGTAADSLTVTIFNPRQSRAFPEHDLPAPMKVGQKLYRLRAGGQPELLYDAGDGAIGSPSVSFDGRSILLAMVAAGDAFFHIYRLPAEGGKPVQLTDGPFHDIEPAELPDGRIVFASTRIGTFEEYHSPPSRALFTMSADGSDISTLTNTIIFDNEPEVLADGRIIFIRSDNFFDRGKVETTLHAIRPNGTDGYTEFGLQRGPEYGNRLRAYTCGSPAPMPDGRVAFLSKPGITIGRPGSQAGDLHHFRLPAGDVAALPDGRLLCTLADRDQQYRRIAVLDPQTSALTTVYSSDEAIHSPVFLGSRPRPPILPAAESTSKTGFLICQNARITRNTTAGWEHVRAIRVLAGTGLTIRSSHSYIVHAGNETRELGTVPLAPDGSFAIEVPADTPLALQAVDAEGRSELNEMSWIYVRPGERRSCLGCHQDRQQIVAPTGSLPQATLSAPLKLLGHGAPQRFRGNNAAVTGLMELQFDRFRETAGIDRLRDPEAIQSLIATLSSDDTDARIAAVQRLAIFRTREAAPALAAQLKETNRELRIAAAMALAACGTRESLAPLLAIRDDSDLLLAESAKIAIENLIGQQDLAPWPEIEAKLIESLNSGDRDRARRAAVASGHVGGAAARVALRAHVRKAREHNPYPEWKKKHRGDGTRFDAESEVNPRSLQEVVRALGWLRDTEAIPLLAETLGQHNNPATGNLFLAEACAEALGLIGGPDAERELVRAFSELRDYPEYSRWYGDHDALIACHSSPVHYHIMAALDAMKSQQAGSILGDLIRSLPIDPDRALFLENDDYEILVGRIIRRHEAEAKVVETCLAILGDEAAVRDAEIAKAIAKIHRCWAGEPSAENRAAQVLSLTCSDVAYEPRIRAVLERYRRTESTIPRVFDTGIPVVDKLPKKHWVCFYLARSLGNLRSPQSAAPLIAILKESPAEAASGRPDPLGPGVLFLHNDLTPCWRAAVAWALGEIGDASAAPVLLAIVNDLENATDTRHSAAVALGKVANSATLASLRQTAPDYPEISIRRALMAAIERREAR